MTQLTGMRIAALVAVLLLAAGAADAAAAVGRPSSLAVLVKWAPLLLWGFLFNIVISVLSMALGTAAGVILGLSQLSPLEQITESWNLGIP